MAKTILLSIVAVLLIIVALLSVLAIKLVFINKNQKSKPQKEPIKEPKEKEIGIKDLLIKASSKNLKKDEIKNLIEIFLKLKWPPKSDPLSDDAKLFLSFILIIASNKNTDAKLVAELNSQCKKANPSYTTQIEEYESTGLSARKA